MATYTTRIGLEKQADGENPNSWGDVLNQNVIDLVDDAIAGYEIVSVSSVAVSLTSNNGAPDQARNFGLRFEGTLTADVTVTIPQKEKIYFVYNLTSGAHKVFMKTAGGTAVTVADSGSGIMMACDGTGIDKVGEISTSVSTFTVNKLNVISMVSGKDAHFDGIVSVSTLDAVNIDATAIALVSASTSVLAATSASVSVLYAQHIDVVSVSASIVSTNTLVATSASITNLAGLMTIGTPLVINPFVNMITSTTSHGLAVSPSFVKVQLECVSAEAGYAAGDIVDLGASYATGGITSNNIYIGNYSVFYNTSIVGFAGTSSLTIINKSTNVAHTLLGTASNWKLTVTPYKIL